MRLQIPDGYKSMLTIKETEVAIKYIKDLFEATLSRTLNLTRVSAPMFVFPDTGLNDNLNGIERPVAFNVPDIGKDVEVVHSLAKWKRMALKQYGFTFGEGIYTDMNAIRRDEELDNTHSIYVDQWDWEKIITKEERNVETLKKIVTQIFNVFKYVEDLVCKTYGVAPTLPEDITFITATELVKNYPGLSPKERERAVCKEYKAVFLMQIGDKAGDEDRHDGRAPDYDDWTLNGDMLFYYAPLDTAFEISSMGIRVDADSMREQVKKADCEERLELPYHKAVLNGQLPLTIGGGLGQSRICMFLLGKIHIGEVQASIWPNEMEEACAKAGVLLL
ncbi:MAG: aspartate--ammonia ligase [Defluviitaleaceae bacterium]|nr:aspartate--ammonia ligase [Defluviitaleaceae bacterium]